MENNSLEEKEKEIQKDLKADVAEAQKLETEIEGKTKKLKDVQSDIKKDVEKLEDIENEEREKKIIIYVNTREKDWDKDEICFKDVVILAYGVYKDDEMIVYTVKFFKGPRPNESGSLTKGHCTNIKKGMEFSVSEANKS